MTTTTFTRRTTNPLTRIGKMLLYGLPYAIVQTVIIYLLSPSLGDHTYLDQLGRIGYTGYANLMIALIMALPAGITALLLLAGKALIDRVDNRYSTACHFLRTTSEVILGSWCTTLLLGTLIYTLAH